jgi:hypothetical protein
MVRSVFVPINDKIWFDFYLEQAKQTGHGVNGFEGLAYQRGHGLGSFFGRLFRSILPITKRIGKSALKTIGGEALNMGAKVVGDLSKGRKIKEALKEHGLSATENLIYKAGKQMNNQSGGYIGKRKVASKTSPIAVKKPRKTKRKRDIFQ